MSGVINFKFSITVVMISLLGLVSCTYVPQKENRVDGVQVGNGMKSKTDSYYNEKYKIAVTYDPKVTYFTESSLEDVAFYTSCGSEGLAPHKLQYNLFPSGKLSKTATSEIAAEKTVSDFETLKKIISERHPTQSYLQTMYQGMKALVFTQTKGSHEEKSQYFITGRGDVVWSRQMTHLNCDNIPAQNLMVQSFRYEGKGPEFERISLQWNSIRPRGANVLSVQLNDRELGVKNRIVGTWNYFGNWPKALSCKRRFNFDYPLSQVGDKTFAAQFILPPTLCPGPYRLERVSVWNGLGNSGTLLAGPEIDTSTVMNILPDDQNGKLKLPKIESVTLGHHNSYTNEKNALIVEIDSESAVPIEFLNFVANFDSGEPRRSGFQVSGRAKLIDYRRYAIEFVVGKYKASGSYYLSQLKMTDWHDEGMVYSPKVPTELIVFNPNSHLVDVVPPSIKSIFFSRAEKEVLLPETLILKRGQRGKLVFRAEDAGSGISEYSAFAGVLSRLDNGKRVLGSRTILLFGAIKDEGNDNYSIDFFVPEDAVEGIYIPENLEISDKNGNVMELKVPKAFQSFLLNNSEKAFGYPNNNAVRIPILRIDDSLIE